MRAQKTRRLPQGKIRYAVVGLGYIAQIAVLPAFAHARSNSRLTALVSGDPKKLRALARKYGVTRTYSYAQFNDCLTSGEIDAVYVALPNHLHAGYVEAASRAGIHALCEKPMALDEGECEDMIAATEAAGVKLMIAYRLHFERGNLQVVDWINSQKIGEPKFFLSVFSQQVQRGNSRLKREVGGGALFDMGIYCINAARYLFRSEPAEVFAWNAGTDKGRFREVPATTAGLLRFPGDRLASFTTSFGAADRSMFEVVGTKGVIRMDPAYEMAQPLRAELTVGDRTVRSTIAKRDQFAAELSYFSDCILNNAAPVPSGLEGLADVRIIRALQDSARSNRPVSIRPVPISRRPSPAQEIARPAVNKPPRLVRAAAPAA